MPAHHFNTVVANSQVEPIVAFLTTSLEGLGIGEKVRLSPTAIGLGDSKLFQVITGVEISDPKLMEAVWARTHIAFTAEKNQQVRDFHAAALQAGGVSNGEPGLRPYGPGYYAAFVRDPFCGINWEVVCIGADD